MNSTPEVIEERIAQIEALAAGNRAKVDEFLTRRGGQAAATPDQKKWVTEMSSEAAAYTHAAMIMRGRVV